MTDDQHFLRTIPAARFLGVGKSTLEKWRIAGNGPPFAKLGKTVLYRRIDLETWISKHVVSSTSQYVQ
ncbi:MAG: helix-turn-helix domain-containing protein [Magnetococcales bacterium]|nr:helix-turn-helix domain-containing protein [Magnetococcales bacterium]